MFNIIVKTIPDDHQRYNTIGDYYIDEHGNRTLVVSDMNDWRYEFLVALHELVESALCKERGITDEAIDAFDFEYEQGRKSDDGFSEPGNLPTAPYYKEHQFATRIEKMMADELGIDWDVYLHAIEALMLDTRSKRTK